MDNLDIRNFSVKDLEDALRDGIPAALNNVDESVVKLLKNAEKKAVGLERWALGQIVKNAEVAAADGCFACQDTGLAVVFLEVGLDVHFDGDPYAAIERGVRAGYSDARKSVADPLTRLNTKDNTPAIVHTRLVEGRGVTLSYLAKGAGSENMSAIYMLTPSKGREGVIAAVVETVKKAGANPCPPTVLGVGVGGNFEKAAEMSKHALLRKAGLPSPDKEVAKLEADILAAVNSLGLGAQGFDGSNYALSVAVETYPTHIGMLPVAVNVQCHSVRHFTKVFD